MRAEVRPDGRLVLTQLVPESIKKFIEGCE